MKNLREILLEVEKPSRYIGGEYGEPMLKPDAFNYCICFPDVYEVGMSNLGIRIVLDVINSVEGACADRCFCPWPDFGSAIAENGIPLFSLGLKKPLKEFDMLGFSLSYEMSYTNVLYMLDLAGIPLLASERGDDYPIIQAGGPCASNGEPLADFVDIFVIGDGEESMAELTRLKLECKTKREFLERSRAIEGVYVPSLMKVNSSGGKITSFTPDVKIRKAVVKNLDKARFPQHMMVGNIEAVHDRAVIEVMRGCYRGCRFCQAGFLYRPIRIRKRETLAAQAKALAEFTGFGELGLNSLSTGDYPCLKELIRDLSEAAPGVKLSLPSLRLDSFDEEYAELSRKSSLTFAPEAGSQRLRDVINKDVTEEEIMFGVESAFRAGYSRVKLYFMIGLPTETDEDLIGIVRLVEKIRAKHREMNCNPRALTISVSLSTFIPKPFTPFQWERQIDRDEVSAKVRIVRDNLRIRGVSVSWNDYALSQIEAVLARGDRSLGKVILAAYKKGCYYDGWNEFFKPDKWYEAFAETGVDASRYTGELNEDDILPWDYLDIGVDKQYLLNERHLAYGGKVSGGCRKACKGCGVQKYYKCDR